MKHSKQMSAGYMMIDHRQSPGLSDEIMIQAGMPPGSGRGLFEVAWVPCNHCQSMVVLNRNRVRPRPHCSTCDHYICDGCEYERVNLGKGCKTVSQQIDEIIEAAIQAESIKEI